MTTNTSGLVARLAADQPRDITCPRCHCTARYIGYGPNATEYVCDNMHVISVPDPQESE